MRVLLAKRTMMLVCCIAVLLSVCQLVLAENLLTNPGFELGSPVGQGGGGETGPSNGWVLLFPGNASYVRAETVIGAPCPPVTIHTGSEAMRTLTEANGSIDVYQKVRVVPGATYTASVYVAGVGAFGATGDSAGLWIHEFDADGNPISSRAKVVITAPTAYTQVTDTFAVGPTTDTVAFMLDTQIACNYWAGWASYDDAIFDGPKALATVSGTVLANGEVVPGALVTIGDKSATTGVDGSYTITNVPATVSNTTIVCSKAGYFTDTARRFLLTTGNIVDFDLIAVPASNLLVNSGWEDGGPTYPYAWNGNGGRDVQGYGWQAHFNGTLSGQEFIWQESDFVNNAIFHTGGNAIRVITASLNPIDVTIFQDVFVQSGSEYTARVWARGSGLFGNAPGDAMGLWIQEFDGSGNVVEGGDHPQILLHAGTDEYELISETFTTQANTIKVRYGLVAVINELSSTAWVVFDDSILDGPAAQTFLNGTVTSEGAPLAGATVSAAGVSAVSESDGSYTLDLSGKGSTFSITASKAGYISEIKNRTLGLGDNTLDFDIVSSANNLLANPGWEDPSPGADFPYTVWYNYPTSEYHGYGWHALFRGTDITAVWQEKDYGNKTFHSGNNAMRCVAPETSNSADASIYQDIVVQPNAEYTARLFIKARGDFGLAPTDSAGLWITEYDASGNPVEGGDHGKVALTAPTDDFQRQTVSFTTQPTTAWVRYSVDCVIACNALVGSVTFDDAILQGPAGDGLSVSGVVTGYGSPVAGVTVTVGTPGLFNQPYGTAVTGADGTYTVDLGPQMVVAKATAGKTGWGTESSNVQLQIGGAVANFDLRWPNLLTSPGWEALTPAWAWTLAAPQSVTGYGWTGQSLNGTIVFEPEADFAPGWPETVSYHGGSNALRAVGLTANGHMAMWQEAAVAGNKQCVAEAWVRCGGLFGTDTNDSAGMHIIEYDAAGAITLDHGKMEQKTATTGSGDGWVLQSMSFQTQPTTAKIRYTLDTVVAGTHPNTWITYDDSFLAAEPVSYTPVAGIADLAGLAEDTKVAITKVVSASLTGGFFYIEELDRSAGIRVQGTASAGDQAEIQGTVKTINGEKTIVADSVTSSPSGQVIAPLGITNRAIGNGLSATGLLVRAWGRVDSVGSGFFTMTDGSGASLKVYGSATQGDYVAVTGALGAELDGGSTVPVVRSVSVAKAD